MPLPDLSRECFFIAPIGPEESAVRHRSDGILAGIIKPAADELNLEAVRADAISDPGVITTQVLQHVMGAKAVVADLTGGNPNVYYELALRHALRLPVALIVDSPEELPFDISGVRAIPFDVTDLLSTTKCTEKIVDALRAAFGGSVDSPIAAAVDLKPRDTDSALDQAAAELLDGLEQVKRDTSAVRQLLGVSHVDPDRAKWERAAILALQITSTRLRELLEGSEDPSVQYAVKEVWEAAHSGLRRRLRELGGDDGSYVMPQGRRPTGDERPS